MQRNYLSALLLVCVKTCILLGSQSGLAQTSNNPLSLGIGSTFYSTLHSKLDPDYSLTNEWSLAPLYQFNESFTLLGTLLATKELTGKRETQMDSLNLTANLLVFKQQAISFKTSFSQYLPLSEAERDIQTLQTASILALPLSYHFSQTKLAGLSLSYKPGIRVNFHQYQIGRNGQSNTQYALSHSLWLAYTVNPVISLTSFAGYTRNFTYAGNSKDSFFHAESVNIQASSKFSISFGHQLNANPLSANGINQDIDFINGRKSQIFLGLSYQL